jgi:hypothetical protein
MSNRYSVFSNQSAGLSAGPRPASQHATQVSTTTLLNALHSFYNAGQSYPLDAGTSLVVNTWVTAATTLPDGRSGTTVDRDMAVRAWEHARRRAEDGCVVLWYDCLPDDYFALQNSANTVSAHSTSRLRRCWSHLLRHSQSPLRRLPGLL